jgi:lipoate-protein ligase B
MSNSRLLNIINLGIEPYKKVWDFQKKLHQMRLDNLIHDTLILLEHPHTYTLGKSADKNHLLADDNTLSENEIDIFEIDRGGDITYHGPGQIVGYPIIRLDEFYKDVHRYLRDLEEIIIRTLDEFDIKAERNEDYTGVWINNNKIAAIGIKVSRWITMHGFAFNINTDLSYFDKIIPCGIFEKGVTSLANELGTKITLKNVKDVIIKHFCEIFRYDSFKIFSSADEFGKEYLSIELEGVQ